MSIENKDTDPVTDDDDLERKTSKQTYTDLRAELQSWETTKHSETSFFTNIIIEFLYHDVNESMKHLRNCFKCNKLCGTAWFQQWGYGRVFC